MTTTHKILSDTKLELKFVTSTILGVRSYSKRIKLNGVSWGCSIDRITHEDFGLYVDCHGNTSNIWQVNAKFQIKLLKNDYTWLTKTAENVKFSHDNHDWGWKRYVYLDELEDHLIDGKFTVEVVIEIESTSGLHKTARYNFEEKDEKLSDVVLVVDGRKLHVGKMILACASPVFKSMFYSDFKESKSAEIPIEGVEYDEFEQFLQLIYHYHVDINSCNAASLLDLADRFDVPSVARKCEQYLITSTDVSLSDKLKISDEFKLSELHSKCLEAITNMTELKKLEPFIEEMGEATANALLKKSINFAKTD